jgi:hypothetical protein
VSVVMPVGDESARQTEGSPVPNGRGDAVRNPAQVSFWLPEPTVDVAMTTYTRNSLPWTPKSTTWTSRLLQFWVKERPRIGPSLVA